MNDQMVIGVLMLWGVFISLVQERFGRFQDLSPRVKQVVNGVLTIGVPILVAYLRPYWQANYGDANEVLMSALIILSPMFIWIISQATHIIDNLVKKITERFAAARDLDEENLARSQRVTRARAELLEQNSRKMLRK